MQFPSTQGNPSSSPPSFAFPLSLSLFPLPSAIHFPLPTLHFLLSSEIGPKSSFWVQEWSGFTGPLPTRPFPKALALGKGQGSSLLAGVQHDLGDEVDDGRGRLVGVKFSKEVAGVVRGAALLPGHKAEELSRGTTLCFHPLSFLWIQVTEGDSIEGVVASEKELSLVVSQSDSLGRDFEVNDGGSWRGVCSQCLRCGFGNGLWPSE